MMIKGLIFEECTEVLSRAQRGRSDSLVVPFFFARRIMPRFAPVLGAVLLVALPPPSDTY